MPGKAFPSSLDDAEARVSKSEGSPPKPPKKKAAPVFKSKRSDSSTENDYDIVSVRGRNKPASPPSMKRLKSSTVVHMKDTSRRDLDKMMDAKLEGLRMAQYTVTFACKQPEGIHPLPPP